MKVAAPMFDRHKSIRRPAIRAMFFVLVPLAYTGLFLSVGMLLLPVGIARENSASSVWTTIASVVSIVALVLVGLMVLWNLKRYWHAFGRLNIDMTIVVLSTILWCALTLVLGVI